ncbi:hypothetical protein [Rhizobium sp.]
MKVLVHLGVHKTATTFIQSQLANNRPALAEKRFGMAGIWAVRRRFTNAFDRLAWFDPFWRFLTRPALRKRFDRLLAETPGADTFLLSDENLAGTLDANYVFGRLYPWARMRTKMLEGVLKGHDTHYFLCIRRYPDYIVSSWLQLATRGRPPAFEKYVEKFLPDRRGWAELVADIASAVGKDKLTVWTYDWFAEDPHRVFALLAPGTDFRVTDEELSREILPSLTIKGLNVISLLEDSLSKGELKRMSRLVRNFEFDAPNPKLEIEDPALVAAYDAKFARDIERIRASGVTLHALDPAQGASQISAP